MLYSDIKQTHCLDLPRVILLYTVWWSVYTQHVVLYTHSRMPIQITLRQCMHQTQCLLLPSHPVLLDGGAFVSQSDLGGGGAELWQTKDGQVLVVQAVVLHNQSLHLLHHREHPGLAIIRTVSWRDRK